MANEQRGLGLEIKAITLWEGFLSQLPISRYCPLWLMLFWLLPHGFAQSHIRERRLPRVPYKLWAQNTCVVVVHMCLGLKAYKAHVGGVSPWCGIEQIREAKAKEHEPKRTIPANWGVETRNPFTLKRRVVVVHMCLGLKAYKAYVGSVSPWCGIEQIREAKAKEHKPKRTIPANWGLRQETLPQTLFCLPLRVWSRQNTKKSTLEFW